MSRSLDDIDPRMLDLVNVFLSRAHNELGFNMVVVDTLRTNEQQMQNIALGVSWTKRSKHLPQPCCNKAHAVDVAPKHLVAMKNWAPTHHDWNRLGELGESLGFKWGGRWKQRDCPHFEWSPPAEPIRGPAATGRA